MVDRLVWGVACACVFFAPRISHAQRMDRVVREEERLREEQHNDAQHPINVLVANLASLGSSALTVALPAALGAVPYPSSPAPAIATYVGLSIGVEALACSVTYWATMSAVGVHAPYWPTLVGFTIGASTGALSLLVYDLVGSANVPAVVPLIAMSLAGMIGQAIAFEPSIPRRAEVQRLGSRSLVPSIIVTREATMLSVGGAL